MAEGTQPTRPPHHVEYDKVRMATLYEMASNRFKGAGDIAQLGIRSALIANGGALIALLAFLGNAARAPVNGWPLWLSFGGFVLGLLASLNSVLCAYLAQRDFGRQEVAGADKIYFGMIQDVENEADSDARESKHMASGGCWEGCGIASFALAVLLFFCGAGFGMVALATIPEVAAVAQ